MEIKRFGSQPSIKRPSEWFTGTVRIDPLFQAPDPAIVQGARVTLRLHLVLLGQAYLNRVVEPSTNTTK